MHTSTDQWQSFEMRMRQRRIERLLIRADVALDAGFEDEARTALEEAEGLRADDPGVVALKTRLAGRGARPAAAMPPTAPAPPVPVVIAPASPESVVLAPSVSPRPPAPPAVVATPVAPLPDQPPAVETRAAPLPAPPPIAKAPVAPRPAPPPIAKTPVAPRPAPSAIVDTPVVPPPATQPAVAPPIAAIEPAPPVETTESRRRAAVWFALAAALMLAVGAVSYFTAPLLIRPSAQRGLAQAAAEPVTPTPVAPEPAASAPAAPDASAPLPSVQVAVDNIPVNAGDTPPVAATAATTAPPPAPVEIPAAAPTAAESAATRGAASPRPEAPVLPLPPAASVPSAPSETPIDTTRGALAASALPAAPEPRAPTPAPAPAPEPAAPPAAAAPGADAAVRSTLARYESAYSRLDADAASAVWPGLDRRALARAFDGLSSQRVSLGSCDILVLGDAATAECTGSATWTPKVGGGTKNQARRWQFRLRNLEGEWVIANATVASR